MKRKIKQISFRDPLGSVFECEQKILRAVHGDCDFQKLLQTKTISTFIQAGKIVRSELASDEDREYLLSSQLQVPRSSSILEHQQIPFKSYPYEWPPEMLYAAASLTLDLAEELLSDNMGLKDASAYNILFVAAKPLFVDVLSFEIRDEHDPIWNAQAQFIQNFLLPLLASKYFKIKLDQIFITKREGLTPSEVYAMSSWANKLTALYLKLVCLPTWLISKAEQQTHLYKKKLLVNPDRAKFILRRNLKDLRNSLKKLEPSKTKTSDWNDYKTSCNYSDDENSQKLHFINTYLNEYLPQRILDIGCNTGVFSVLAARSGSDVVAIDSDETVIGNLWRLSEQENLSILPLRINIANPSPAIGWLNEEQDSFLNRSRGNFDSVFMLAIAHHLLVTERIPLDKIFKLASDLTSTNLLIEYVGPTDPMFKVLLRGRENLFIDLTLEKFEQAARLHFEIIKSVRLANSDRQLFHLKKIITENL